MTDPFDFEQYAVSPSSKAPAGGAGHTRESAADEAALEVAHPPLAILGLAIGIAAVGVGLAVVFAGRGPLTIVPWVLAGPGAISALSAFTLFDNRARAFPVYASGPLALPLYVATVLLIAAAVLLSALQIAFWVGRA